MELYQGIVVDNEDPDKVGKVRIRIPVLHGNGISANSIQVKGLPWFEPCMPWYGGYQSGSFIVPPVGSIVWCVIQKVQSGIDIKVYLGGSYGIGASKAKPFGDGMAPAGELETPKEALEGYPNSAVIFKSLQGSSLIINNDGTIILSTEDTKITMTSDQINIKAHAITLDGNVIITKQLSSDYTSENHDEDEENP